MVSNTFPKIRRKFLWIPHLWGTWPLCKCVRPYDLEFMELNTFIRAILTSLLVCWWEAGIIFLLIHFYFKGTRYNYLFSVKTGYFDFLKFKYWNKSWHFVLIISVGGIWWNEMAKVLHQSIVDWIKCSILALILFQCIRDGLFIYYTKFNYIWSELKEI